MKHILTVLSLLRAMLLDERVVVLDIWKQKFQARRPAGQNAKCLWAGKKKNDEKNR